MFLFFFYFQEGKAGRTPLHLAIEEGRPMVANFLLEECVDKLRLETLTYGGLTAYQLAVIAENNVSIIVTKIFTQNFYLFWI